MGKDSISRRFFALVLLLSAAPGCAAIRTPTHLPVANSVSLEQLVIYGDFELPQEHRILTQLDQMRSQIATQLDLAVTEEPIHVYLFKTPKRYRAFLKEHFPGFPDRRALFVQTETRLSIYAQWGDRVAEDLRHEVTHGYVHAVVPDIPLWIDEGLAEYFEVARRFRGVNQVHLDELGKAIERGTWHPRLAKMDAMANIHDMQQLEYAEAWAWAHYLLNTTPDRQELLRVYLRDLAAGEPGPRLAARIQQYEPAAEANLLRHLQRLSRGATSP